MYTYINSDKLVEYMYLHACACVCVHVFHELSIYILRVYYIYPCLYAIGASVHFGSVDIIVHTRAHARVRTYATHASACACPRTGARPSKLMAKCTVHVVTDTLCFFMLQRR